jgi:uncharacterized protein YabN with tetrapyrrole methylase and pyrophosphatase domain
MHSQNACQAILALLDVMKALRAPGGCPWDAQQSPESLAAYILEEAAELVDAIESGDVDAIRDEAGDLLLQVVFLAQIYTERGLFNFADVAQGITRKLIRRHPHVFENADSALSASELDHQWESIKRQEKPTQDADAHPLGHIPINLPALQRARKILDRAAKIDLDLHVGTATEPDQTLDADQLGHELFALVCKAQRSGLDAEQALRHHLRKVLELSRSRSDER